MIVNRRQRIRACQSRPASVLVSIVLVILLAVSSGVHASQGPLLAAASSLRSLWPDLTQQYIQDTGQLAPVASFASSGLLSTQIINGAPFELFLSADIDSITRLPNQNLTAPAQVYALGALQLVVPQNSPLAQSLAMTTLADALASTDTGIALRLAIPNPIHAPYGKAAREALRNAGIWPIPSRQLLAAENAAQALQFVKTGAVGAAIVPQALVHGLGNEIVSVPVPPETYKPVKHAIAVLSPASNTAKEFHHWLLSKQSRQILENSGLQVPVR